MIELLILDSFYHFEGNWIKKLLIELEDVKVSSIGDWDHKYFEVKETEYESGGAVIVKPVLLYV